MEIAIESFKIKTKYVQFLFLYQERYLVIQWPRSPELHVTIYNKSLLSSSNYQVSGKVS